MTQHRVALARRAALVLGGLALLGVLGFLLLSAMRPPKSGTVANAPDPVSIFVLPFRNPTPYLHRPTTDEIANEICARMTDALIDALAEIDGVRVGPRKSGWIFEPEEILRRRAAQAPYRMAHASCGHLEITNAWIGGRVEPIPELLALEGRAYALMGQPEKAREILAQLDGPTSYVSPYFVAWVHAALNGNAAALEALERACVDRSERLVNSDYGGLRTDPAWDGLRDDPRFEALCRRVGLGKDQWPK